MSARAATSPRDERLELEEELARIEEVLADDRREWEVLRVTKTEDLVEEREVVRNPVRYLRIMDVLMNRLEPPFTKDEQRSLLGDPFTSGIGLDGYFTYYGLEYKDSTLGSLNQSRTIHWNENHLPRPDRAKPDRDGLPVTQANLSREDLLEAQRVNKDLNRLREIRDSKLDRYTSLLSYVDLLRLVETEPDPQKKFLMARNLVPRIPKGTPRKQVIAWAGESLATTEEGEEYFSMQGIVFLRYEKDAVATVKLVPISAQVLAVLLKF